MAVQFEDTGPISIGGSSINTRDVSVFQRGTGQNYAGQGLVQLAQSLEGLSGAASELRQAKIDKQMEQTDLYVSQIQAGFGTQATDKDILDVTSALHPKVRQRVTEDYMFGIGTNWARSYMENMPHDVVMSPEAEQAFYTKMRQEALAAAGGDPLRAAGFMKAVQGEIGTRSQQTSAQRVSDWNQIQKDGFANTIAMGADRVSKEAVVPQLSSAITSTAQKYQAPWLVGYLTRTAQLESSGGRNLANPSSSARGPFQFISSTAAQYGLSDPMDFDASTDAAARLAMDNYNYLKSNLGREPTMSELYLAHQQGAGGALKLLKDPNAKAVDVVGVDAVRLNGGAPGMTAGQFAGLWTSKFGDAGPLNTDPNTPIIPAEAQALREHFFGTDAEYKATSSLLNAERRDIAAQTFMEKALEYRDERFLLAMPEELMTPQIRAQYAQAREQIGNLKMSDLRDQEFQREQAEKETIRSVQYDVINRRSNGEQIDPIQMAIGPDGRIDPIRLQAAQAALSTAGNMISDVQSKREAAALKDVMRNAFLKGDFSKIPLLQFSGEQPSADDLRSAILMNPYINDADKLTLFNSVEQEMGVVSFLQDPKVEKHYDTYVSSTLEGMLRDPIISVKLTNYPNIRDQVREAFDLSLMTQIEANGGVPMDMRSMLKEATADAREVITNLTAGNPPPPVPTTDSMGNSTGVTLDDPEIDALIERNRTK